ncbi:MAG TPA: hypothetical protein VK835_00760 [Bacteroidia bacterium]|nr:hypothetical protein [Bacteroidia bacterium]
MKTLSIILLLVLAVSCKTVTTKPIATQAKKTFMYDYRNESAVGYIIQSKLHYYNNLNTVFIKLEKSKGRGC